MRSTRSAGISRRASSAIFWTSSRWIDIGASHEESPQHLADHGAEAHRVLDLAPLALGHDHDAATEGLVVDLAPDRARQRTRGAVGRTVPRGRGARGRGAAAAGGTLAPAPPGVAPEAPTPPRTTQRTTRLGCRPGEGQPGRLLAVQELGRDLVHEARDLA